MCRYPAGFCSQEGFAVIADSQSLGMLWAGRDLKDHGQRHLPLAQLAPNPIQAGHGHCQGCTHRTLPGLGCCEAATTPQGHPRGRHGGAHVTPLCHVIRVTWSRWALPLAPPTGRARCCEPEVTSPARDRKRREEAKGAGGGGGGGAGAAPVSPGPFLFSSPLPLPLPLSPFSAPCPSHPLSWRGCPRPALGCTAPYT